MNKNSVTDAHIGPKDVMDLSRIKNGGWNNVQPSTIMILWWTTLFNMFPPTSSTRITAKIRPNLQRWRRILDDVNADVVVKGRQVQLSLRSIFQGSRNSSEG